MRKINMLEAKTNLSKLVEAVESGAEDEIIIARNGRATAKLVAVTQQRSVPAVTSRQLGLAEGKYRSMSLEDLNATSAEIARMFGVDEGE